MAFVYIIYSESADRFYVGATSDTVESRIQKHLSEFYGSSFTSQTKDWQLFLEIDCSTMTQALQLEKHIKKMKSRTYINNLKLYPEIIRKLKEKYQ